MLRKHALALCMAVFVWATVLPLAEGAPAVSETWCTKFYQKLAQHPEMLAERAKRDAQIASADAVKKPLYNPEIEAGIEREGEDRNVHLGISQGIDLWGKSEPRRRRAEFMRTQAEVRYQEAMQTKASDVLLQMIEWQDAQALEQLSKTQERHLGQLLNLLEQRRVAGDLGEFEATLTYLALSQQLTESAEAEARKLRARASLAVLLPTMDDDLLRIPEAFWAPKDREPFDSLVAARPAVQAAWAEWQQQLLQAREAGLEAKSDPVLGIGGGKNGDENVVSLSLSVPLAIRNNRKAEVRAAQHGAISAEALWQNAQLLERAKLESARQIMQAYQQRYSDWQSKMAGPVERSAALLEKQWKAGDLATQEYLQALKESTEARAAGIALKGAWHVSVVHWLEASNQLLSAVGQPHVSTP
ncbi:Outer membrane protein [gamma proteobacterium HdN1]|nr:Outer membrane protein [gamma proteobacterium HdN1]